MNRAEIREKFPDITDEQLDWLMNVNGNDVNAAKNALNKELEEQRKANEALQKAVDDYKAGESANLTREQQLEAAMEELKAKQVETQRGYNRMAAASELSSLGLDEASVSGILDMVVGDDQAETLKKASDLAGIIKAASESAASAALKEAQTKTPAPEGGAGKPGAVTKEQFDSMTYAQRLALFNESPDLYNQYTQGE